MNAPDRPLGLRINPDWAKLPLFDQSKWQRTRFGDVVENINDTCDPAEEGVERFIGLEHLEPGSLHIGSWGNVSDGTTFTRCCRSGQVLFGKRRAYQRKVAVADFDAVVSGDIYVLAPKNERLLAQLLPYICISDRFFEFAVGTSAGSLSPRTNWSSLAAFEFDLPPIEQQRRIAEIILAADSALQIWRATIDRHARTLQVFASDATSRGLSRESTQQTKIGEIPASWECRPIADLTLESAYGPRFPSSAYAEDGNAWQIRTTDFDRAGGINFADIPRARLGDDLIKQHRLKSGDFLLSRSGEYAGMTAVFRDPVDQRAYIPGAFLIRYRFNGRLDTEFLLKLCNSAFGERFVKPLATGSAQPNISGSAFSRLLIPIPAIEEQRSIVKAILELEHVGKHLAVQAESSRHVLRELINSFA